MQLKQVIQWEVKQQLPNKRKKKKKYLDEILCSIHSQISSLKS